MWRAVEGHIAIVPKEHISSIHALSTAVQKYIWALVAQVRDRLRTGLVPDDGFSIGFVGALTSPQLVDHAVTHVIPRRVGDRALLPECGEWINDKDGLPGRRLPTAGEITLIAARSGSALGPVLVGTIIVPPGPPGPGYGTDIRLYTESVAVTFGNDGNLGRRHGWVFRCPDRSQVASQSAFRRTRVLNDSALPEALFGRTCSEIFFDFGF